jgi:alkylation response protein AidB-like acyl-CoA dehydrogenase
MDFSFTPEQLQFRDSLHSLLDNRYSFAARQQALRGGAGWRPEIWHAFADELGLLGLTLPQASGGLAGGPVDLMVVMEELGSALVVEPYLETVVLCGHLLAAAGGKAAETALAGIVRGEQIIALAW